MPTATPLLELCADDVVHDDLMFICERLGTDLSALAGKRLLLTGGGGFLGYYLVKTILHHNQTVTADGNHDLPIDLTVYDNFMRGRPRWLAALHEGRPNDQEWLHVERHDVSKALPDDMGDFHYIIHAASIASPTFYRQYPIATMDANVNGLRHLLEYCRVQQDNGKPIESFLFFSTSEIYGDPTPDDIPTPETYRGHVSCTGPRACYDEAKRFGETLCVNFADVYELPIKIARPFNNYGPGLKLTDRRVVPDFARNILTGQDITILSSGTPTRTFCYIADAIIGYFRILTRGRKGEPYNIGVDSPEISMRELAERMAGLGHQLLGYDGNIVCGRSDDGDYLVDNPDRRCPNIDKARAELDFQPCVSLDEGLKRTLIWYRDQTVDEESQ